MQSVLTAGTLHLICPVCAPPLGQHLVGYDDRRLRSSDMGASVACFCLFLPHGCTSPDVLSFSAGEKKCDFCKQSEKSCSGPHVRRQVETCVMSTCGALMAQGQEKRKRWSFFSPKGYRCSPESFSEVTSAPPWLFGLTLCRMWA